MAFIKVRGRDHPTCLYWRGGPWGRNQVDLDTEKLGCFQAKN